MSHLCDAIRGVANILIYNPDIIICNDNIFYIIICLKCTIFFFFIKQNMILYVIHNHMYNVYNAQFT